MSNPRLAASSRVENTVSPGFPRTCVALGFHPIPLIDKTYCPQLSSSLDTVHAICHPICASSTVCRLLAIRQTLKPGRRPGFLVLELVYVFVNRNRPCSACVNYVDWLPLVLPKLYVGLAGAFVPESTHLDSLHLPNRLCSMNPLRVVSEVNSRVRRPARMVCTLSNDVS